MARLRERLPLVVFAALFLFAAALSWRHRKAPVACRIEVTIAEAQAVHPDVTAGGRALGGSARLVDGDTLETGSDGRARARLDDGTDVFLDRDTRITVRANGVSVVRGRALVRRSADGRVAIDAAGATATIATATVGVDVTAERARMFCASGEMSVRHAGREARVSSGETAAIAPDGWTLAPERAYRDFTAGLAAPWSALGAARPAIGELWGKPAGDDVGAPLTVRRHEIDARLEGEVAVTTVTTTYFNGGSATVSGDFRMAIPPGALVSRFALDRGEGVEEASVAIGGASGRDAPRLEWAGEDWVRGAIGEVAPGRTVTVVVGYVAWLPIEGGRLVWRYPLAATGEVPLVGDFRARVDLSALRPRLVRTRADARVVDGVVELGASDVRPRADLVVEVDVDGWERAPVRAYVARAAADDPSGDYLLVRADVPPPEKTDGTTVAIVLDASASIDDATLDAERALTNAILDMLGARDRAVVLAADQTARVVGPPLGAVDPARRDAVRAALATVQSGGASDLGITLARAADAVASDPAAIVLYVGDGWPTVGETSLERVRARLGSRAHGLPRLVTVAAGPRANRFGLAALAHGVGSSFAAVDREDAAALAVTLVARALRPARAGVELDLGAGVARVFPWGAHAVALGDVASAVGRISGARPVSVTLRHRDGAGTREERLSVAYPAVPHEADVRRRWGSARLAELARRGDPREIAVDVARRVALLTPWTGFAMADPYLATAPELRLLALDDEPLSPSAARLATPRSWAPPLDTGTGVRRASGDDELARAVEAVVRRQLDDARGGVRSCRDARVAERASVPSALRLRVTIAGDGRARRLAAHAASGRDDAALDRCVESTLAAIAWPESGLSTDVVVEHELALPALREARPRGCSSAAALPLPVRRGVWRDRVAKLAAKDAHLALLTARSACEVPTWTDVRVLLELVLEAVPGAAARVSLARSLDDASEPDAAAFVRREAIRRAEAPDEARAVRSAMIGDEGSAARAFAKRYEKAIGDDAKLAEVRRFLVLAPHDDGVRRRWLTLLERRAMRDELRAAIRAIRDDALAGAALLGDAASTLRRLGEEDEARRAFGELVERAPTDPSARAYLGDRLRDEGWFDDAAEAYEALSSLAPGEPAGWLRLALAHAGAGRVDLASRELAHAAEDGGRRGDERLAALAAALEVVLLADARATASAPDLAVLERRAARVVIPPDGALVLVRVAAEDEPLRVATSRERGPSALPILAPSLGLALVRVERGDRALVVRLAQPAPVALGKKRRARVFVITPGVLGAPPRVVASDVDLATDGKETTLRWDGERLVARPELSLGRVARASDTASRARTTFRSAPSAPKRMGPSMSAHVPTDFSSWVAATSSPDELALGIPGFSYADLYLQAKLAELTARFDAFLASEDPEAASSLQKLRDAGGTLATPRETSDALVVIAPWVSAFVAKLFRVEAEWTALKAKILAHDPVWRFKHEFTKKRVLKGDAAKAFDPADAARVSKLALVAAGASSAVLGTGSEDEELALAIATLRLFDVDDNAKKLAKSGGAAWDASYAVTADDVARALAGDVRAAELAGAILSAPLDASAPWARPGAIAEHALSAIAAWLAARRLDHDDPAHVWQSLREPKKVDHLNLVQIRRPDPKLPELFVGPEEHRRAREGFTLTDRRASQRQVQGEVDYCLYCHDRDKDSCSKGLRDAKTGALKPNPIGVELAGCPLDEKISEMHLVRRNEGDALAALALVCIDNPMVPGTGHRICNDCMKACIFQKQEPVNIPQIETATLTDVLALPWGLEIYGLLTRWNPLNVRWPHPAPLNGRAALVVGLGPAGYTLAHHLSRAGFAVAGVDGLKLEPLPVELTGDETRAPRPMKDWRVLTTELDERIVLGFGGVSEYGITVRWDKSFLSVLYLTVMRNRRIRLYGGVRFGGTLDLDDSWKLGFDHVALAAGAGRPTIIDIKNNLARGIRKASDFLMALQLAGAYKTSSLSNLQVELPAIVIGGGLTAIDTATELIAYYVVQAKKSAERMRTLVAEHGEAAFAAQLLPHELAFLRTQVEHAAAIEAEEAAAAREGRPPLYQRLIDGWGGVSIVYRKSVLDSPAYRLNHEEVEKSLEEGVRYIENLSPTEAVLDELGAVKAVKFDRLAQVDGKWRATGEVIELPARTVCIAAGTSPNTTFEKERPGALALDAKKQYFLTHSAERHGDAIVVTPSRDTQHAFFASYVAGDRTVSVYGDNHPYYAGSVVKAMASAKVGFEKVAAVYVAPPADEAETARRREKMMTLFRTLDHELIARVTDVVRLTPTIVEVIVHAPAAARKFEPGQFYRLQNFESNAPVEGGARLAMEGLALTGAWVDKEKGLLSTIVLEMGASTRICAMLKKGEQVVLMGPTGTATEIEPSGAVLLAGGGLGNAVLFSIARATKAAGSKVLYFAGYRRGEDLFHQDDIEAATDQVVWCTDSGATISPRRAQDREFRGNIVQAMVAYAKGELGERSVDLKAVKRVIAIGSDKMMAAVARARHDALAPFLDPKHVGIGSINSPMQCMMKEICAQCLQKHKDPVTGKETMVFSCTNQDQELDRVDWENLAARLGGNTAEEKLTNAWLSRIIAKKPSLRLV